MTHQRDFNITFYFSCFTAAIHYLSIYVYNLNQEEPLFPFIYFRKMYKRKYCPQVSISQTEWKKHLVKIIHVLVSRARYFSPLV